MADVVRYKYIVQIKGVMNNRSKGGVTMTVELTKSDIIRLLKGTSVPYELWYEMPKDLGSVEGGGWTDPAWHWSDMFTHFDRYNEEELFNLYQRILKTE